MSGSTAGNRSLSDVLRSVAKGEAAGIREYLEAAAGAERRGDVSRAQFLESALEARRQVVRAVAQELDRRKERYRYLEDHASRRISSMKNLVFAGIRSRG